MVLSFVWILFHALAMTLAVLVFALSIAAVAVRAGGGKAGGVPQADAQPRPERKAGGGAEAGAAGEVRHSRA